MSIPDRNLECGHSLEELSTYLDTGDISDPRHLAECPDCQAALASLRNLKDLGTEFLGEEIAAAGKGTDDWMQSILDNLRLELRPGRTIPLRPDHPGDTLSQTEGAITALVRAVGDAVEGIAVGKCRLRGDVTVPGAPVTVEVQLAVLYGHQMMGKAAALREHLAAALARHTELNIAAIDLAVSDVLQPPAATPPTTEEPQP
ncbi:putative alkaline shock family protein YloU [Arthrobacter sp. PvP023]|uniref:Asp23/Gls24 family envelope stress response protein n=1 Tax=Micrococcaceae TaxID=1268 RepID=UPI001AE65BA3|nr:Asp23/Gls24 family envelope stress response protein [Arthrobacter sp. PvP023]MBP1134453.1 putative alkaline shock family protein YloU [Arthrobacter sp. PvP023]